MNEMMTEGRHPFRLLKRVLFVLCLVLNGVRSQSHNKQLSACELESILKELVYPEEGYGMHAYQLRNQLSNLLDNYPDIDEYQPMDNDLSDDDKRSVSALAKNGLLTNGKRHIGSLGNLNLYRPTVEDVKKSIATLAKNGQLPSKEPETDETPSSQWSMRKRNVAALARSGLLGGKRNIAAMARNAELWPSGKRNLQSIVRTGMRPSAMPKRNLAALARGNMIPYFGEQKKNVGTLARDWSLPKTSKINSKREINQAENNAEDKRNIGSFKNSQNSKVKRDISFEDYPGSNAELLEPAYQPSPADYEKYQEMLNELYPYYDQNDIHEEKRFLGSIVRGGWSSYRPYGGKRNIGSLARMGLLRSDFTNDNARSQYRQREQKRHIGALARSSSSPYQSDFASQSRPFVNDVDNPYIQMPIAGVDLAYDHGVHHPDSPHYTNAVSEDHFIRPDIFTDSTTTTNQNSYNQLEMDNNNILFDRSLSNANDIESECKQNVQQLLMILDAQLNYNSDNNYYNMPETMNEL